MEKQLKLRNRYGDCYDFKKIDENKYVIVGDLKYWRYGGQEGQEDVDYDNLGFVDPSGGPFIGIGSKIEDRKITRIWIDDNCVYFEVE